MTSWDTILEAVAVGSAGPSGPARHALQECWDRTRVSDHAERCVLAHFLADQQADPSAELEWDARALAEHGQVAETAFTAIGIPAAAGFLPSLHLNLGVDQLRAGDLDAAREHLAAARAAQHLLSDEGYGAMVRGGIDRLGRRLDAAIGGGVSG